MIVMLIRGAAFVLFDAAPSVLTCNALRAAGFKTRFETIWQGTKDDLCACTHLPRDLMPQGCAAVWPDDWSSND